jgi:glutaconyl-CoA/methylmalonyl-CoA decarboxylase subunit delta
MFLALIQNLDNAAKASKDSAAALNKISFNPDAVLKGSGIFIIVADYLLVFFALLLLYFVMKNIYNGLSFDWRSIVDKSRRLSPMYRKKQEISGETNAAIAMALHLLNEEHHDEESTILTIKKNAKPYSPWGSKIYGLRRLPR